MTSDRLSVITTVLESVGTLPIGVVICGVVLGPWIISFYIYRAFEAMKRMYEDNVKLVKSYEKIAENLQDLIILNTQAMTKVSDRIDILKKVE